MPVHTAQVVGSYVYRYADDSWWWSDGMRAVYGEVPADGGLDQLTSQLDDHESDRLREALVSCVLDGTTFGLPHRVVDADGNVRSLTITGGSEWARSSSPEIRGLVLDVEPGVDAAARYSASLSLGTALASHAVIDQAKGALMLVYGLGDEGAFDLLRWSSMRLNVKLSMIAQRVVLRLRDARAMSTSARDAFEAALARTAVADAPASGPRSSRVVTSMLDGHAPVVTVLGDADLRCAKDLFEATNLAWTTARERGLLVVDLERATHLGTTVLHTLATITRRAARDDVTLRVDLPPGDPHGWARLIPAGAVHGRPPTGNPARPRSTVPHARRGW